MLPKEDGPVLDQIVRRGHWRAARAIYIRRMDGAPRQDAPAGWSGDALEEQLHRRARLAELADRIRACLDDADDLGLWRAGAYLDQALHALGAKR